MSTMPPDQFDEMTIKGLPLSALADAVRVARIIHEAVNNERRDHPDEACLTRLITDNTFEVKQWHLDYLLENFDGGLLTEVIDENNRRWPTD